MGKGEREREERERERTRAGEKGEIRWLAPGFLAGRVRALTAHSKHLYLFSYHIQDPFSILLWLKSKCVRICQEGRKIGERFNLATGSIREERENILQSSVPGVQLLWPAWAPHSSGSQLHTSRRGEEGGFLKPLTPSLLGLDASELFENNANSFIFCQITLVFSSYFSHVSVKKADIEMEFCGNGAPCCTFSSAGLTKWYWHVAGKRRWAKKKLKSGVSKWIRKGGWRKTTTQTNEMDWSDWWRRARRKRHKRHIYTVKPPKKRTNEENGGPVVPAISVVTGMSWGIRLASK